MVTKHFVKVILGLWCKMLDGVLQMISQTYNVIDLYLNWVVDCRKIIVHSKVISISPYEWRMPFNERKSKVKSKIRNRRKVKSLENAESDFMQFNLQSLSWVLMANFRFIVNIDPLSQVKLQSRENRYQEESEYEVRWLSTLIVWEVYRIIFFELWNLRCERRHIIESRDNKKQKENL